MAFPQTIETLSPGTNLSTLIDEAFVNPHRVISNALQAVLVGPIWRNVIAHGADPTGAADSSAAFVAAIVALGTQGGTVFVPAGLYRIDAKIVVPSRVRIMGAGMYATKLFASASFTDDYMFDTDTTAGNTLVNVYGQTYGQIFQDFEIRDRNSADTSLTQTGRSEDHHGINLHETDWGLIRNVNIRDLRGTAINMIDVVREWYCDNVYIQGCGDSAELAAAVFIQAWTGDPTNTIAFHNCRIIFPEYIAVAIVGNIDNIRLITFSNCQIEGGGNGSGGTYGNPWPYDLVWLGRMNDAAFTNCNFANPGAGKWCVNIDGNATTDIFYVGFDNCRFNGNAIGGGIRLNNVTKIATGQCVWSASTVAQADYYVEVTAGIIVADISNVQSVNPTAGTPAGHFRGRETVTKFNLGDTYLAMDGGGYVSYVAGKPTTNLGLGSPAPNGMEVYDITNDIFWQRVKIAGTDYWQPRGGQVVGRRSQESYANDTTERSVFNYSIPQGAIDALGGIRVDVWGTFSGTGVGTATLRIKLNGTTIYADASPAMVSGTTPWYVWFIIRNGGAVNAQRMGGLAVIGVVAAATTGRGDLASDEISSHAPIQNESAIDMSSAARVLEVTWQHSAAKVTTVQAGQAVYQ